LIGGGEEEGVYSRIEDGGKKFRWFEVFGKGYKRATRELS